MKLNNIYSFNPRQNITSGLTQTVILPLLLAMPILEIKQIASAQSLPPLLTPTTPLAIEKVEAGLRLVQLGDLKGAIPKGSAERCALSPKWVRSKTVENFIFSIDISKNQGCNLAI